MPTLLQGEPLSQPGADYRDQMDLKMHLDYLYVESAVSAFLRIYRIAPPKRTSLKKENPGFQITRVSEWQLKGIYISLLI